MALSPAVPRVVHIQQQQIKAVPVDLIVGQRIPCRHKPKKLENEARSSHGSSLSWHTPRLSPPTHARDTAPAAKSMSAASATARLNTGNVSVHLQQRTSASKFGCRFFRLRTTKRDHKIRFEHICHAVKSERCDTSLSGGCRTVQYMVTAIRTQSLRSLLITFFSVM